MSLLVVTVPLAQIYSISTQDLKMCFENLI